MAAHTYILPPPWLLRVCRNQESGIRPEIRARQSRNPESEGKSGPVKVEIRNPALSIKFCRSRLCTCLCTGLGQVKATMYCVIDETSEPETIDSGMCCGQYQPTAVHETTALTFDLLFWSDLHNYVATSVRSPTRRTDTSH